MPFAVSRAVFAPVFLFAALPAFAEPAPKLSSRDEYRICVDEQDHRSDELNAHGNAIDQDMSAYNAAAIALNQRCAGMVVTTRVHNAVLKLRAVNPKK